MEKIYLSVDLGGTNLRIGALDGRGKVLKTKTIPSREVQDGPALVDRLAGEFGTLLEGFSEKTHPVQGTGLGVPGLVEFREGRILQSPHFPRWDHFELKKELSPRLSFPVFIENDANKAALGESWLGAGKDTRDFIMLTLGTGIGAGIIHQGKIFHGSCGFAGEVGHMVLDMEGLPGALGIRGTLETFASASGLRLQLEDWKKNRIPPQDPIQQLNSDNPALPEQLNRLAREGNPWAIKLWDQFGRALACGVASLANVLGIFDFVLGGGLLGAWERFHPAFEKELPQRIYAATVDRIRLSPAKLGQEAGLIGGVPLIEQGLKES